FKQRSQTLDQKRVVFKVSIKLRDTVLPRAKQCAVFSEIKNHEFRIASRGGGVITPASAKLAIIRPFQAVRIFSSRPGLMRISRNSKSLRLLSLSDSCNSETET